MNKMRIISSIFNYLNLLGWILWFYVILCALYNGSIGLGYNTTIRFNNFNEFLFELVIIPIIVFFVSFWFVFNLKWRVKNE